MRIVVVSIVLFVTSIGVFAQKRVDAKWVDKLEEDFAFSQQWDYPLGVYVNRHGQVSCDGFCPDGAWSMRDSDGRIYGDSLLHFYELVDTTHQMHSFKGDVQVYEYSGINYIDCHQMDSCIICSSRANASTHSVLELKFAGEDVTATIAYNSIRNTDEIEYFQLEEGSIIIEKKAWLQGDGVLKAKLDLTFLNHLSDDLPIFWKGLVYAEIGH